MIKGIGLEHFAMNSLAILSDYKYGIICNYF